MIINKALIIIDVQMDMFNNPSSNLYKGNELLENVKKLINKSRENNVPVIYIKHTEEDGMPMAMNQPGWEIHPEITPEKEDTIILKHTPDSFYETTLHKELQKRNIKDIVLAGLQTEYCVDTTIRCGYSLGYNITLASDAHSTFDNEFLTAEQIINHHNGIIGNWFANVKPTDEINFD